MVAIFTGLGAGFERGSGAALGGGGLLGSSSLGRGGEGVFLNAANGNLVLSRQDEFLVGRGPDIAIARTYNSLGQLYGTPDDNGDLWRQSTDRRILGSGPYNVIDHTVRRLSADGSEIIYTYKNWGDGSYYRATDGAGAHDKLEYSGGAWTWTDGSSQITERYEAHGADNWRIVEQKNKDGNALTYTYVGNQLSRVTTSDGGYIEYGWTGANLTSIVTGYDDLATVPVEAFTPTRTRYEYDGSNRLIKVTVDFTPHDDSVTDADTYWTSYSYDGASKRVATIEQKDGSKLDIHYDPSNRVDWLRQTVSGGETRTTTLSYVDEGGGFRRTEITDPRGQVTKLRSNAIGELIEVIGPPAHAGAAAQSTTFAYDGAGNVLTTTDAAGGVTRYIYDAHGNTIRVTDPNGNKSFRVYDIGADYEAYVNNHADLLNTYLQNIAGTGRSKADWGEEHWMLYGSGESRTLPLLAAGGGTNVLLRETRIGASASASSHHLHTRYVYDDENHLRYVIGGEGGVSEFRYADTGELSFVIEYPTHAYPIGFSAPDEAAMNQWRDGIADRSSTKITKYFYDARGAVTDIKNFGKATPNGAEFTAEEAEVVEEGLKHGHFVYDQAGRLLSRRTESQAAETFVYDGLGRLILSTDLTGGKTSIVFNDAATTTTVTTQAAFNAVNDAWEPSASSYVTISTYNKAGELIRRMDLGSAVGANDGDYTTGGAAGDHLYDKNGQLRVTTDATGRKSYFLYDKTGRKIVDIGHDGQVIEYRYDQANRLVATARYQNVLTAGQLVTLGDPSSEIEIASIRPATHSWDIRQWSVYDAGGRVIETIMGDGSVTTYEYDQADRLVKTQGFANKLTSTQISGFMTTPPAALVLPTADANKDRVTRSFYDRDGRLIGTLNAEGALSRALYDSAGQKVQDIAYANLTQASLRASGAFDQLLASFSADPTRDVSTRYVYDGQGLLRFTIDALNRVSELIYWSGTDTFASGLVRKTITHAEPLGSIPSGYAAVKIAVDALPNDSENRVTHFVYNDKAQLAYAVDATGAVTRLVYDSDGRVVRTIQYATFYNAAGLGTDAQWESNLNAWANANGAGTRITRTYYSERGEVRYVIDAEGYVTQNDYDQEGRLATQYRYSTALTAANDSWTIANVAGANKGTAVSTQYAYDNLGRLEVVTDPVGTRRAKVYRANGTLEVEAVAYQQNGEARTQYFYDQAGKLVTVRVSPDGLTNHDIVHAYDGLGNLVSTTEPGNRLTSFAYDKVGRVVTRTDALAGVTTFEYDALGRGVRTEDARGNAFFAYFDRLGRVTLAVDAEKSVTRTIYSPFGEVETIRRHHDLATGTLSVTAPPTVANHSLDAVTMRQYDKLGRLVREIDPEDGVTEFEYDAVGNLVKKTDALGNDSFYYYDKLNRLDLVIDAELYATVSTYNPTGTVASSTRRYNRATGPVNTSDRPTTTPHSLDATASFTYDAAGRAIAQTDAQGAVTQFQYDRRDNLVKVIAPGPGAPTSYNYYDKMDRVFLAIDAEGYATRTEYLATTGEVWKVTRYATKATNIGDVDVAPTTPANPADAVTSFAYDALGLVSSTTDAMGGVVSYTYDKNDNVVKIIDARGNASHNYYDKLNRVTLAVDAEGYATGTTYQATGEVKTVTRSYERVQGAVTVATPPTVPTHTLDAATTFDYDHLGRVIKVTDALGETEEYTLDALGNRLTVKNKLDGITYNTFDKRGLLVLERLPIEALTAEGSMQAAFVENAYGYDARGNLILKVEASNLLAPAQRRTTTYEYDRINRRTATIGDAVVVTATATAATSTSTPIERAIYDARGNVIETIGPDGARNLFWYDKLDRVTHKLSALGTLTRYVYDDASDNVAETHTYTIQTSLPLDATGAAPSHDALGAPQTTQYEYDKLGRVIEQRVLGVTAAALGTNFTVSADAALVTRYEYDANGNLIKTIDANERATYAYYDKLGRKSTQIDAAHYRTDWTYDANGNVLSERRYAIALPAPPLTTPANVNLMRGGDLSEGTGVVGLLWDGGAGGAFVLAIQTVDGAPALTLRKSGGTAPAWDPGYVWGGMLMSAGGDSANAKFSVSEGETVAFAIDVKQLAVGPHTIRAGLVFLDANGTRISWQGHQTGEGDAWERLSGTGVAPAGAVYAQIEFGIRRSDGVTNGSMDFAVRNIQFHKLEAGTSSVPAWIVPAVSADDRVTTFTYDKMGRRLTETRSGVRVHNGSGAQTSADAKIVYTYNEAGQVETKTESSGDIVHYTYDLGGRMTREQRYREMGAVDYSFTDVNGVNVTPTVDYFYGGLDQLMRTVQAGTASAPERVTKYAYDPAGRMTGMTDAAGFVRTYRYDAAGRVTREEYVRATPNGASEEAVGYTYDAEGRVTRQGIVLKQGGVWTRDGATIDTVATLYNAFGEVSKRGFAHYTGGAETVLYGEEFFYNAAGRLERTNAGDGVWKYFMYDKAGNQTLMLATVGADFAASNLDTLDEVLGLWANHAAIATANVAGVTATITKYDARNQAIEVLEPKREVHVSGVLTPSDLITARAYTAFGEVAYEINAGGARVDYTYNTMGRLIKTESPAVSITGVNGAVTANYRPVDHLYYDVSGRLVAQRDANDYLTRYTLLAGTGYGGSQALIAEAFTPDNAPPTRTKYDIHGDARRIEDPLYDPEAPTLHVTMQTFDAMGRLVQMTRAASLTQSLTDYYRYDGLGQRIRHFNSFHNASYNPLVDPSGAGAVNATTTTYDHQGRIVQVVAPGGDATKYAYAWDGTLLTKGMNSVDGVTGTPFGGWVKTTTFANGKALTEKNDVFGHDVGKLDMSGHTTHFTYDKAGRLTQRNATYVLNGNTVAWGDTLHQSYFNTGRLKEVYQPTGSIVSLELGQPNGWYLGPVIDSSLGVTYRGSTFGYDKLGNVVFQDLREVGSYYWQTGEYFDQEMQATMPGQSGSDPFARTVSRQTASYDALGRIVSWSEEGSSEQVAAGGFHYKVGAATHTFFYDAAGNIRRSLATYHALNSQGGISADESTQDYWYLYDAMNRMVTSKGVFVGAAGSGSIQRGTSGGVDTVYNLDGTRAYALTSSSALSHWREQYYYDAVGRVLEVKAGSNPAVEPTGRVGLISYDALGRLLTQSDYNGTSGYLGGGKTYSRLVTYNAKSQIVSDDSTVHHSNNAYRELSTYDYGDIVLNGDGSVNVADTDYALGSALRVDVQRWKDNNDSADPDKRTDTFYDWYDGAVAHRIEHYPYATGTKWTTTYHYDAVGGQAQLESATILDGRPRTVAWTNDMLGQVVRRSEKDNQSGGDPHEIWHRFSGRQMGYVGNNGTYDVTYHASRGQRQTPGSPGPGSFADFDLAHDHINSYEQGSKGGVYTVQSGDTLQGIAAALWGDASLWYRIAEVNGLTASSTLIEGQPLLIPVGVQRNENNAATYQPYDPLEVLGNTSPTSPKPNKGKQCGVIGQIALVVIAVVVTMYGLYFLGNSIVGFALAGAAGSAASQGAAMAAGYQDRFSWNGVALAAVTSAVTGGAGGGVGGQVAAQVGEKFALNAFTKAFIAGAVNSTVSQAVGYAMGWQDKFSWAGVAAAGVSAGVLDSFGLESIRDNPSLGNIAANAGASTAAAIANAATRSLMNGGDFGDNIMAALPDVIGQTIGEAIAGRIAGSVRSATSSETIVAEGSADDIQPSKVGKGSGEPLGMSKQGIPDSALIHPDGFREVRPSVVEHLIGDVEGNAELDELVERGLLDTANVAELLDLRSLMSDIRGDDVAQAVLAQDAGFDDYTDLFRLAHRAERSLNLDRRSKATLHWLLHAGPLGSGFGAQGRVDQVMRYMEAEGLGLEARERAFGYLLNRAGASLENFREGVAGIAIPEQIIQNLTGRIGMPSRGGAVRSAGRVVTAPVRLVPVTPESLAVEEGLLLLGVRSHRLRQRMMFAGFNPAAMEGASPTTLEQFYRLFQRTVDRRVAIGGKLGTLETRIATITRAVELERQNYRVAFEVRYRDPRQERWADIVATRGDQGRIIQFETNVNERAFANAQFLERMSGYPVEIVPVVQHPVPVGW